MLKEKEEKDSWALEDVHIILRLCKRMIFEVTARQTESVNKDYLKEAWVLMDQAEIFLNLAVRREEE